MALSVRAVAWSAFRAGSLRQLCLRPGRSGARLVLVCAFGDVRRAGRFATLIAPRVGRSVALRRAPGGLWAVSVPVAWPHTRLPEWTGWPLVVSGGVRGFALLLRSLGLWRNVHRTCGRYDAS